MILFFHDFVFRFFSQNAFNLQICFIINLLLFKPSFIYFALNFIEFFLFLLLPLLSFKFLLFYEFLVLLLKLLQLFLFDFFFLVYSTQFFLFQFINKIFCIRKLIFFLRIIILLIIFNCENIGGTRILKSSLWILTITSKELIFSFYLLCVIMTQIYFFIVYQSYFIFDVLQLLLRIIL